MSITTEEVSEGADFNTTALVSAIKEQLDKGIKFADMKEAKEAAADLRRNWAACAELMKSYPTILDDIAIHLRFSEIRASHVNELVMLEAVNEGELVGKAVIEDVILKCAYCGAVYSGKADKSPGECPQCKRRTLKREDSTWKDYSVIYVKELPRNIEAANEDEIKSLQSKTWRIYYNGIPPNARYVKVVAYVTVKLDKKATDGEIEFLAKSIEPLEDESTSVAITEADHETFLRVFGDSANFQEIVRCQIDPRAVGKELHKEAALLVLHSPLEIHPINGNTVIVRGALRSVEVGDTKVTKTERMIDISYGYYHLGELIIVETSSRTGILYTPDAESKVIHWGTIPLNDRGLVLLDGMQHISDYEMGEMKETLNQGRLKVNRVVKGERPARVRLIAALNPGTEGNHPPMSQYYYRIDALRDTSPFADPANLTRWDIVLSSALEDVDPKEYIKATTPERPISFEIFRRHVLWAWSLKPDDIIYTDDTKQKVIDVANELSRYISAQYPLIHGGVAEQVTRMAAAYAVLRHSVDETHKHVVVRATHVEMASDFIYRMMEDIDYDAFILGVKEQTQLTQQDIDDINNALTDTHRKVMLLLVKKAGNSDAIATAVGLSTSQILHKYYPELRRYRLIDTSKGKGARLTVKGIQYLKTVTGAKEIDEAEKEGQQRLERKGKTAFTCMTAYETGGYAYSSINISYIHLFDAVSKANADITLHLPASSIPLLFKQLLFSYSSPSVLAHHSDGGGETGGSSATSSPSQEAAPLLHPPGHSAETPDGKPTYDFKVAEAVHKKAVDWWKAQPNKTGDYRDFLKTLSDAESDYGVRCVNYMHRVAGELMETQSNIFKLVKETLYEPPADNVDPEAYGFGYTE